MTQHFHVRHSRTIFLLVTFLYLAVNAIVIHFHLPISAKIVVISLLLVAWLINHLRPYSKSFQLIYESKLDLWSLSEDRENWQQFRSLDKIYVNQWFVWVVLSNSDKLTKGLIIGRDSLPSERYLQLRRCILCPEVLFHSHVRN